MGEPVWSPDGTRIAFTARVPDEAYEEEDEKKRAPRRFKRLLYKLDNVGWTGDRRRHLFVVPADGSARGEAAHRRRLRGLARRPGRPTARASRSARPRGDDWDIELIADIYVVPAEGGEPKRLTPGDGATAPPATRRTGRCSRSSGHRRLRLSAPPADRRRRRRHGREPADPDRVARPQCEPYPELREPIWDGDSIVFAIEDGGSVHIYRVAADGRRARAAARRRAASSAASTSRTADRPHAGRRRRGSPSSTSATPADRHRQRLPRGGSSSSRSGSPRVSKDGTEVEAWIVRPAGFEEGKRYPVLLNIHGGPFTQYGSASSTSSRSMRAPGYAVVYANPRGSSGYGEEWGRAIWGRGELGPGLGHRRLRGPDGGHRRGARAVRLPRPGAPRRHRRLVRRLHDLVDRLAHEPLQGGLLRAGGEQPGLDVRLERHRLGLQGLPRRRSCTTTSTRSSRCRRGCTRRRSRRRS